MIIKAQMVWHVCNTCGRKFKGYVRRRVKICTVCIKFRNPNWHGA